MFHAVSKKRFGKMVYRLATTLTLKQADIMVSAALAHGEKKGLEPLAVCVLDAGGQIVVCKRQDGAGLLRLDIAYGKAWGALGMGLPSRTIAERLGGQPAFLSSLTVASQGRLVPGLAGLLIGNAKNDVIGAIGISGDIGECDEEAALAGIVAAGFTHLS
jgi:uncharacterized protein GlcG (DUF336 family)